MNRKKAIAAIAAAGVIGLVGVRWWQFGDGAKELPYVTTPAQRASITQVVSSTGTLQAVVTVQVGSQVSGTIEKLFADFNTKVKAGQIVAQLNQDKFRAAEDQARGLLPSVAW